MLLLHISLTAHHNLFLPSSAITMTQLKQTTYLRATVPQELQPGSSNSHVFMRNCCSKEVLK